MLSLFAQECAASSATPAIKAAAIVPRKIAAKYGSVLRSFLRINSPPPPQGIANRHCNRFAAV
jgi:hypothetical protein